MDYSHLLPSKNRVMPINALEVVGGPGRDFICFLVLEVLDNSLANASFSTGSVLIARDSVSCELILNPTQTTSLCSTKILLSSTIVSEVTA